MSTPRILKDAPLYTTAVGGFVLTHQNAIWAGFNSNSSDIPILMKEHARFSLGDPKFDHRLDVMRLIKNLHSLKLSGSLSAIVSSIDVNFVTDAHIAMADTAMTVFALEHALSNCNYKTLIEFGLLTKKHLPAH